MADSEFAIIRQQPSSASVPLILVHDGGGTIFPYFAIHDIGRDMYGIALSGRGQPWEDGIADIAEKYTALIKAQSLPSAVILGGWSLGGIIALEMARLLHGDPELEVKGVVMMESIYPPLVRAQEGAIDPTDVTLGNNIDPAARSRILKSLDEGHEAVKAHCIQPGSELTATVLIKAEDPWPSLRGKFEMPEKLGWDDAGLDIVKDVYSTSGHHYSIFDEENATSITANLSEACTMLENGVWG